MSDYAEQPELDLNLPPEFERAPPWARTLAHEARRERHRVSGELQKLGGDVGDLTKALGREPKSDGRGGEGLIGDVRKMNRDLAQLMNLKMMGVGFAAALTVFGALILLGVSQWIKGVLGR